MIARRGLLDSCFPFRRGTAWGESARTHCRAWGFTLIWLLAAKFKDAVPHFGQSAGAAAYMISAVSIDGSLFGR
jgi:hypothetical protein